MTEFQIGETVTCVDDTLMPMNYLKKGIQYVIEGKIDSLSLGEARYLYSVRYNLPNSEVIRRFDGEPEYFSSVRFKKVPTWIPQWKPWKFRLTDRFRDEQFIGRTLMLPKDSKAMSVIEQDKDVKLYLAMDVNTPESEMVPVEFKVVETGQDITHIINNPAMKFLGTIVIVDYIYHVWYDTTNLEG